MSRLCRKAAIVAMLAVATLFGHVGGYTGAALADQPRPWQMGYQQPATEVMHRLTEFHDLLLVICFGIVGLVIVLMAYIAIRFNRKANPVASKTSHNTTIEVLWTLIPVLILVFISVPSFKLLYLQDRVADPDMTIKAIGNQWYWSYEYPDEDGLTFDAVMLTDEEAKEKGAPRLLGTDNHVVVPVGKAVRVLITATDVIHSWAIPAFGLKLDAVPGRLNETWFRADKEGLYYGQCSELCGLRHAYMPIVVEVVSAEKYAEWLKTAKEQFAMKQGEPKLELAAASLR